MTKTVDLTTMTDDRFYGGERDGFYAKQVEKTTDLARKVWLEVADNSHHPEADLNDPYQRKYRHFETNKVADLNVGDLVAYGNESDISRWGYFRRNVEVTLAEWLGAYGGPRLALVVKKTAKQVTVECFGNPAQYFQYDFDFTATGNEWSQERWGDSGKRPLVNLGNAEALMAKVAESEVGKRYATTRALAEACNDENDRRRQAERDAEKAKKDAGYAQSGPIAGALNRALGFKVFVANEDGTVSRDGKWTGVPTAALQSILVGRATNSDETMVLLAEHAVVEA